MGEDAGRAGRRGGSQGYDRLTIQEAARRLAISEGAVRKRVTRGTLRHDKGDDGRVYVYLDAGVAVGVDAGVPHPDTTALISRLEDEVRFLREELARKDAIVLNMTEAMKAVNPPKDPSEEPSDTPEPRSDTPTPTSTGGARQEPDTRPWWRRWMR